MNPETEEQFALRKMGFPNDAIDAQTALRPEEPLRLAYEFAAAEVTNARFLVLLGKKGTGKTVAAAWVAAEIAKRWKKVDRPSGGEKQRSEPGVFVRATTLARLNAYDSNDKEWFESLCRCWCLVIDDLGSEFASGPFHAQLYELLDRRYGSVRRTVITSNLDKVGFAKRYGDRIADRLRERGMSAEFTGDSLRLPFAEARP